MNTSVKHNKQNAMLIITILLTGLVAGLLYGYMCSVNPGLHKLGDKEYLSAMQSINIAIQNPVFFVSFMGSVVAFVITAFQLRGMQTQAFYLLLTAMVIYIIGVLGVTMMVNVPLNNRPAGFDVLTASHSDLKNMRLIFEARWNAFHTVRTMASIASFVLCIVALAKLKQQL